MAKRRKKSGGHCAGRTSKGRIKKGYKLNKRGGSCPVKVR